MVSAAFTAAVAQLPVVLPRRRPFRASTVRSNSARSSSGIYLQLRFLRCNDLSDRVDHQGVDHRRRPRRSAARTAVGNAWHLQAATQIVLAFSRADKADRQADHQLRPPAVLADQACGLNNCGRCIADGEDDVVAEFFPCPTYTCCRARDALRLRQQVRFAVVYTAPGL